MKLNYPLNSRIRDRPTRLRYKYAFVIKINYNQFQFSGDKKEYEKRIKVICREALLCTAAHYCVEYIGTPATHSVCHENGENCCVRFNRIKCLLLNHNVIMVLFASAKVEAAATRKR